MTTRATLITCLLLLYAPSSHAWTWLNHVTIAQVAYEELSPSTRLYVDRVSDAPAHLRGISDVVRLEFDRTAV